MRNSESKVSLSDEMVARYIRDPGSYGSKRSKDKKRGKPLQLEEVEVIPFRLFRPRTGESVTSLVRRKFGKTDTILHGKNVEAVGLVEFDVDDIGRICSSDGVQQFRVLPDPLNDFESHAILMTPCIDDALFPKEKGDSMDPKLKDKLASLYNQLYQQCCSDPKPLNEVD